MYYNYNIKGEIVRVWVWGDDFHKEVTVFTSNKNYDRTIRQDDLGAKFFTWNKERVYLRDYIKITMKELKEKLENGGHVVSDDLTQAIMNEGIENVRFTCPLHPISMVVPQLGILFSDGSEYLDTLCMVVEERYEVKNNYKIEVVPVESKSVVPDSYYISDMLSLIKLGHIKIVL